MDILCISARAALRGLGATGGPHASRELVGRLAPALVSRGHRVRWFCLLDDPGEEPPRVDDSVEVEVFHGNRPKSPFRDVLSPLADLSAEAALQKSLRARPADVVHVFGFGAPGNVQMPWVAERLGARVVISADTPAAICHRGTLVDETGSACERFDDAARCTACCLSADGRGDALGGFSAWLGRRARILGDASPWPDEASFLSRLDLVVGSAVLAAAFLVEDETAVGRWRRLGVGQRVLQVFDPGAPNAVDSLLECYGRGAVSSATSSR